MGRFPIMLHKKHAESGHKKHGNTTQHPKHNKLPAIYRLALIQRLVMLFPPFDFKEINQYHYCNKDKRKHLNPLLIWAAPLMKPPCCVL